MDNGLLGILRVAGGPLSQIVGKFLSWPQVCLMHMCEVWDCHGWHFLRGTWEIEDGGVTLGGQCMEAA